MSGSPRHKGLKKTHFIKNMRQYDTKSSRYQLVATNVGLPRVPREPGRVGVLPCGHRERGTHLCPFTRGPLGRPWDSGTPAWVRGHWQHGAGVVTECVRAEGCAFIGKHRRKLPHAGVQWPWVPRRSPQKPGFCRPWMGAVPVTSPSCPTLLALRHLSLSPDPDGLQTVLHLTRVCAARCPHSQRYP